MKIDYDIFDYPPSFTEEDKNLYLEYVARQAHISLRWYVGTELAKKIESMLKKVKDYENYRRDQLKRLLDQEMIKQQKRISERNYLRNYKKK